MTTAVLEVGEMTRKEILIEAQKHFEHGDDPVHAVSWVVGPFEAGNGDQCDAFYGALKALDRQLPERKNKKDKKLTIEFATRKQATDAFRKAIENER